MIDGPRPLGIPVALILETDGTGYENLSSLTIGMRSVCKVVDSRGELRTKLRSVGSLMS